GLAVLEYQARGLARVRPRALSRPRWLDPRAARAERALDDLGLAQVLSRLAQLRRARRGWLSLPAQPRREAARLPGQRLHRLRRVRSRRAPPLLGPDRQP